LLPKNYENRQNTGFNLAERTKAIGRLTFVHRLQRMTITIPLPFYFFSRAIIGIAHVRRCA